MLLFRLPLVFSLCLLSLVADIISGIQLIQENGFRAHTHYYHLGDGGHAYHVNSKTPETVYFKCVIYEKGCHGRAILKADGRFRHSNPHNHPPNPEFVGERQFRENIYKKILESKVVSFQDVLDQFRQDKRYSRKVRASMNLRRLSNGMARIRSLKYPTLPDTLVDLTRLLLENDDISKTIDDDENLYAGSVTASDGSHHVAFFSPRMLKFLDNLPLIQGDGTFKTRPAVPASRQIFVIVTSWNNCVVPIGWFLMEKKSLAGYRACFQLLKNLCPNLNPKMIVSDWEYVQQQAWSEAFPNAEIHGCWWHLSKAFLKKAKSLRLLRFKKVLPSLFVFVNKASCISLLPSEYFEDALRILRQEALDEDYLVWHLLDPFFDYVHNNWLNVPQRRQWMCCFRVAHRTNNNCECHNRVLRKKVGAYRPNVWLFIEALVCLENNANLDVYHMDKGGSARRARRAKSIIQDRNIKSLTRDLVCEVFNDKDTSISNFLTRASELTHSAFEDLFRELAAPRQQAPRQRR